MMSSLVWFTLAVSFIKIQHSSLFHRWNWTNYVLLLFRNGYLTKWQYFSRITSRSRYWIPVCTDITWRSLGTGEFLPLYYVSVYVVLSVGIRVTWMKAYYNGSNCGSSHAHVGASHCQLWSRECNYLLFQCRWKR